MESCKRRTCSCVYEEFIERTIVLYVVVLLEVYASYVVVESSCDVMMILTYFVTTNMYNYVLHRLSKCKEYKVLEI